MCNAWNVNVCVRTHTLHKVLRLAKLKLPELHRDLDLDRIYLLRKDFLVAVDPVWENISLHQLTSG